MRIRDWSSDVCASDLYRNLKTSTFGDNAIATVPIIPVDVNFERHYVYQELRAASTLDGSLHLLGGATYLDNRLDGTTNLFLLSNQIPLETTQINQTTHNWSVYAQAGSDLTDRLDHIGRASCRTRGGQ